jgi:hypothetical protein
MSSTLSSSSLPQGLLATATSEQPLRLLDADAFDTGRVYVLGHRMPFDEDQQHEFKALHQHIDRPARRIVEYAARYINAFLNTVGGMLFCGVDVRYKHAGIVVVVVVVVSRWWFYCNRLGFSN